MEKIRYHLLDHFRGLCIIGVVIYHIIYDLSEIFGGNYDFMYGVAMECFRIGMVTLLIILSGISCSFSRSNLKRGIKTLLCALLITVVTAIILPQELIVFGILHFFACAMLLYALIGRFLAKIPTWIGVGGCMLLYFFTVNIGQISADLPHSFLLYAVGFPTGFHSADYYPLLPWLFLFLAGCFLGKLFVTQKVPLIFTANPYPFLSYIGKNTLIIYLLHQPIVYGILCLWFSVIK